MNECEFVDDLQKGWNGKTLRISRLSWVGIAPVSKKLLLSGLFFLPQGYTFCTFKYWIKDFVLVYCSVSLRLPFIYPYRIFFGFNRNFRKKMKWKTFFSLYTFWSESNCSDDLWLITYFLWYIQPFLWAFFTKLGLFIRKQKISAWVWGNADVIFRVGIQLPHMPPHNTRGAYFESFVNG